ncbi:MAG: TlpA disulfide reductase family protein [Chitinophagaceae bacterium]
MNSKKIIPVIVLLFAGIFSHAQQQVPNITDPRLHINLPDAKGDSIALASLKGKVVLLDFWASWCMPCRAANKKLVKIYDKFKAQGFEIYSVSVDDEKRDWVKAVEKDRITWLQVNDPRSWGAQSAVNWNIEVLPTTFLINKKGDVVVIDPEEKKLETAIKNLLQE